MTDDDLTRDLEAWAAATDPATDPIVPSELADTDVPPLRRPGRSTRVLAVAAAVVVLLGLAAAVVVTRRHDGEAGVVTDDGGTEAPIGPRTQIVVETPKGAPYQERDVRQRYALHGPCGRRAVEACAAELAPIDEGPLRHGTSLIVDQALEPGTWALVLEVYLCGSAGCLSTDATGAPGQTTTGSSCTTVIEAVDRPTVVARMLTYGGNAETSCESDDTGAVPALDVPPAWSLRPDLPWDCGSAFSTVVSPDDDPGNDAAAFTCFTERSALGPVELPILEEGATTPRREAWWRRPGGPGPTEVFRAPAADGSGPWITTSCSGGSVGTSTDTGAAVIHELLDCTDEEELSLDLPPLDEPLPPEPTTEPTTTISDEGSGPTNLDEGQPLSPAVDVVIDGADLPRGNDPVRWAWAVTIGDGEVGSGTVHGDDADGYLGWPVALVYEDLVVGPTDTEIAAAIDAGGIREWASTCTADTTGPEPETEGVLIVRPGAGTCTTEWTDAIPALTVPPAWSLRIPATECLDLALEERGPCLVDVFRSGARVGEWSIGEAGVLTTYRVAPGAATVVRRAIHPDAVTWSTQSCTGIEVAAGGPDVVATGCGDEMPMTLDPP